MKEDNPKKEYTEVKISLQAIIVGVILAVTSFLLLLDSQKNYTSSFDILVIPKSTIAAYDQGEILANLGQFPKSLSFYENLLKNNPDINDFSSGKSINQKKQAWDDMVLVGRADPGSSILRLSITAKNQADGEILSQRTTRALIDTASQYYNIKTDIDFRIIDGPIVKSNTPGVWWILPLSLLLGCLGGMLLQMIVNPLEKMFAINKSLEKNEEANQDLRQDISKDAQKDGSYLEDLYKKEESDIPFSFEKYYEDSKANPLPMEELEHINKHVSKSMYPNFPEMPASSSFSTTASAPDNLPIADDFIFMAEQHNETQLQPKQESEIPEAAATTMGHQHQEPTEEELKNRLNQLLKGEL
jgi:tetratricopeptide (TPR) repeat protein